MSELSFEQKVKRVMGYVQNDTNTSVTFFQDDVTHDYHVRVGDRLKGGRSFWGRTLAEALDKANEQINNEGEWIA